MHKRAKPQYERYQSLIGSTPMVDLSHLIDKRPLDALPGKGKGIEVSVVAKVEYFNPGFSMKDRIVKEILDDAERRKLLQPGGTIVAASSGNTGAATAMMAAMRGYKAVITTSPKCSQEKMDSIRAYGATLVVSPPGCPEGHPDHYMNIADRMADENPGWFNISQYDNKRNPQAHFNTLGPEIWAQTSGEVTHFVTGGSTGGTISGVGRLLKEKSGGSVRNVLADPKGSIFAEHHATGSHGPPKTFLVEGVGKGDIPGCMDFSLVDEVFTVADDDAFTMCRTLAQSDGILAGGSAGMNVFAAVQIAERLIAEHVAACAGGEVKKGATPKRYTIATVLCDSGIKYLTKIYNKDYLEKHGFSTERTFLRPPVLDKRELEDAALAADTTPDTASPKSDARPDKRELEDLALCAPDSPPLKLKRNMGQHGTTADVHTASCV